MLNVWRLSTINHQLSAIAPPFLLFAFCFLPFSLSTIDCQPPLIRVHPAPSVVKAFPSWSPNFSISAFRHSPLVPKGQNLNSRGRQPTVPRQNHIRPRRGRTFPAPPAGLPARLFMFLCRPL